MTATGSTQPSTPTRRRVLALAAVATVLPVAALRQRAGRRFSWQGIALGAPASITLYHHDAGAAQAAVDAALRELARVESIFSLYRADSAISRLNRAGHLDDAPAELVAVLDTALAMARATGGVFDPSVQPLWQLHFDHFVARGAEGPPDPAAQAAALRLVDWRRVQVDGRRVRLAPGMALTLNGIAQGHATDCCTGVLRAHGFDRMLVDMGEPRALAPKPDGSAWTIAIADPRDPARAVHAVEVVDRAVATSGGYGTRFDAAGRHTHLIDARSGRSAPAAESVTVIAPTAARADVLSTALALLPPAARPALVAAQPACRAICVDAAGRVTELG